MKITYGKRAPGYRNYQMTKIKTHELLENYRDFLESDYGCVQFMFDSTEETMHAVNIIFAYIQECKPSTKLSLDVRGKSVYLRKVEPVTFDEKTMLKAIFGFKMD